MKKEDKPVGSKKRPYSSPKITKVTHEQARKLVADRTNCSGQEAENVLESLRQEQHRMSKKYPRAS